MKPLWKLALLAGFFFVVATVIVLFRSEAPVSDEQVEKPASEAADPQPDVLHTPQGPAQKIQFVQLPVVEEKSSQFGPVIELTLNTLFDGAGDQKQATEFCVSFTVESCTPNEIRVTPTEEQTTIKLIDDISYDDKSTGSGLLITKSSLQRSLKAQKWRFTYAAGVVNVFCEDRLLIDAHVDNSLNQVVAITVGSSPGLEVALDEVNARFPRKADLESVAELGRANTLNRRVYELFVSGKYREAEPIARQCLEIRRRVLGKDDPEIGLSLLNLSAQYQGQGRIIEAVALIRQAINIQTNSLGPRHPLTATMLGNLGTLHNARGEFSDGEQCCRQVVDIFSFYFGADDPQYLQACITLANVYSSQHEFEKAIDFLSEILAKTDPDEISLARAAALEGLAHAHWGLWEEKRKARESSVLLPQAYVAIASECVPRQRKALAIRRKLQPKGCRDIGQTLGQLALYLDTKDEQSKIEAQQVYKESYAILQPLLGDTHEDVAGLLNDMAMNAWDLAEQRPAERDKWLKTAADHFRRGVNGLDRLRPQKSLERLRSTDALHRMRTDLALVLARLKQNRESAQVWEEYLSRSLLEDLQVRQVTQSDSEEAKERRQLQRDVESMHLLEKLSPSRSSHGNRLAVANARIAELDAKLSQQLSAEQSMSIKQIQIELPEDVALVGWLDDWSSLVSTSQYGYVIRNKGEPFIVRLKGSRGGAWTQRDAQLAEAIPERLASRASGVEADLKLLRKLRWTQLEGPLAKQDGLPPVRHVVVLPSVNMKNVPVETLCGDTVTISYAPSGTLLSQLRRRNRVESKHRVLLLGSPNFAWSDTWKAYAKGDDQSQMEALPGTESEIRSIAELMGKSGLTDVVTCQQSEASEQRLRSLGDTGQLQQFTMIHIATHGIADQKRALNSRLILARDTLPDPFEQFQHQRPVYDGVLTASEVLNDWNLNADLVVLSACESVRGKYVEGEGNIGFAQALLLAGARSVLLSLWKVDDTATALLMTRFYENLLGARQDVKPMALAVALQEAKSWLKSLTFREADQAVSNVNRGLRFGSRRVAKPSPDKGSGRPYQHPFYWAAFILIGNYD